MGNDNVVKGLVDATEAREADFNYHFAWWCRWDVVDTTDVFCWLRFAIEAQKLGAIFMAYIRVYCQALPGCCGSPFQGLDGRK